MGVSQSQFEVLLSLYKSGEQTQRALSTSTGLSLGAVNSSVRECIALGYVEGRSITDLGREALEPYRVDNAVIMAAGFSSRFAPLSYERPKGVLEVRGEVLIERQIRQLREAGINDITVVVGYMKEAFFYLADKFGVEIAVNEEYATRNNNSTLMLVKDKLHNTYICSSDNYFAENVFESHVYRAYYSTAFVEGPTDEYCITTGSNGRIVEVVPGGSDSLVMIGHVYFDREFSDAFAAVLTDEYLLPETAPKLWEDIYLEHLAELNMAARVYEPGVVYEFDSLNDLLSFDHDFILNVDSTILDNICTTLGCSRESISDIQPIKEGLTNLSFRFDVVADEGKGRYVYRHPGAGTEEIINRASETFSQGVARDLGIDDTFIYEDPEQGWKLSRYVPDCVEFDYHNPDHVSDGLRLIRRLHQSGRQSEWSFDVYQKATEIVGLLQKRAYPSFPDFDSLNEVAGRVYQGLQADGVAPCLCHNDFYAPNFLVSPETMSLIDWEYSAMSDYASDLGTFICCSDYTVDEARGVIGEYFEREPTFEEMRHCLAYVAISAHYWFVWALYKEASGDPVGEWLYLWYKAARSYGALALDLYK